MSKFKRRDVLKMAVGAAIAGATMDVLGWKNLVFAQVPRYGGGIVHALPSDPDHFLPAATSSSITASPASAVIEALVSQRWRNGRVELVPELAKAWNVSSDGLTYTIQLRETTWHDGKPFTAEDVQFTLSEVTSKLHPLGRVAFRNLAAIDVIDPGTVRLRLNKPFAPLMQMMSIGYGFGAIVPKHIYQGTDPLRNPANRQPIGTGPYKFAEWARGDQIRFERNRDYWKRGRPYLDRVVVRIVPDPLTATNGLISGSLDQAEWPVVPYSQVFRLRRSGVVLSEVPQGAAGLYFMSFNLRNPTLRNTKVRQAIAHAIDRDRLQRLAFYGLSKKATAHLSSTLGDVYWNPGRPLDHYEYDPGRANALLDEAGFPRQADGTRFTLMLRYSNLLDFERNTSEIFVRQLGQVGIRVTATRMEYAAWLDAIYSKWDFDVYTHTLNTGPFPELYAARLYISTNIQKGVAFSNAMGYENPEIDALFDQAAYANDPVQRQRLFHRIQDILANDLPNLPLWEVYYPLPTRSRFSPAAQSPMASGGEWLWGEIWDSQATRSQP